VFTFLGLSVGVVASEASRAAKAEALSKDITYLTGEMQRGWIVAALAALAVVGVMLRYGSCGFGCLALLAAWVRDALRRARSQKSNRVLLLALPLLPPPFPTPPTSPPAGYDLVFTYLFDYSAALPSDVVGAPAAVPAAMPAAPAAPADKVGTIRPLSRWCCHLMPGRFCCLWCCRSSAARCTSLWWMRWTQF